MASPDPRSPVENLIFALYGYKYTKEFSTMAHNWWEHFGGKPPRQFGCESLVRHADIGNTMDTMYPTNFLYTHEKINSAHLEPRSPANPRVIYLSYVGLPARFKVMRAHK